MLLEQSLTVEVSGPRVLARLRYREQLTEKLGGYLFLSVPTRRDPYCLEKLMLSQFVEADLAKVANHGVQLFTRVEHCSEVKAGELKVEFFGPANAGETYNCDSVRKDNLQEMLRLWVPSLCSIVDLAKALSLNFCEGTFLVLIDFIHSFILERIVFVAGIFPEECHYRSESLATVNTIQGTILVFVKVD